MASQPVVAYAINMSRWLLMMAATFSRSSG
jgi:hypothetical protein